MHQGPQDGHHLPMQETCEPEQTGMMMGRYVGFRASMAGSSQSSLQAWSARPRVETGGAWQRVAWGSHQRSQACSYLSKHPTNVWSVRVYTSLVKPFRSASPVLRWAVLCKGQHEVAQHHALVLGVYVLQ